MRTLVYAVDKPNTVTHEGYVVAAATARHTYWDKNAAVGIIKLENLKKGDVIHEMGYGLLKVKEIRKTEFKWTRYELDVEELDVDV